MSGDWRAALAGVLRDSRLRPEVPLRDLTTLRVGGPADALVDVESEADLLALLAWSEQARIPCVMLGKGSNLLAPDEGLRGIALRLGRGLSAVTPQGEDGWVRVGAGLANAAYVSQCRKWNLGGMEFLVAVPGTIGGAVAMNAGAHGHETSEFLETVRFVEPGRAIQSQPAAAFRFGYRDSPLRSHLGRIVLEARFRMVSTPAETIREREAEIQEYRRRTQPREFPNCGSVFTNPPGDFAGRLIEQAGLKGRTVGGAQVSPKHANFIVNTGTATASDVLRLIDLVRETVYQQNGVRLELELQVMDSQGRFSVRLRHAKDRPEPGSDSCRGVGAAFRPRGLFTRSSRAVRCRTTSPSVPGRADFSPAAVPATLRPLEKPLGSRGLNPVPARPSGPPLATRVAGVLRAIRLPKRVPGGLLLAAGLLWLVPGTIAGLARIWEEPLTHVRVEGAAILVPLQVAAAAGLQPGLKLGGLDPLTVAARVLANPWVERADVRRIFPGRMEVRIRERTPAALVMLSGGHTALVDDSQRVLERDPSPERFGTQTLPAVYAAGSDAVSGLPLSDSAVRDGMVLVRTYQELLPQHSEPIRVDARNPLAWRLFLPDAGRELLVPARDANVALGKFVEFRFALEAATPGWRRADLRAAERHGPGWIALTR